MSKKKSSKSVSVGGIIVAEPFMKDPHFMRSAILIAEHDSSGTVGFIFNKPTAYTLNEAVEEFPIFNAPLYFGGPVDDDTLFYVHTIGSELRGAIKIKDHLWWGGDFDHLRILADTGQIKPSQIRFFAGYAGWDPHGLEFEIKNKQWILHKKVPIIQQNIKAWIFENNPKDLWSEILKSIGDVHHLIISNFPIDPALN